MSKTVKIECDKNNAIGFSEKEDSTMNKLAKIGQTAVDAAVTLKALCEVMNVNQDALKEKMVINSLQDGLEYPGDLNKDALSVIKRLIKERDEYKNQLTDALIINTSLKDKNEKYSQELKRIDKKVKKAATLLRNSVIGTGGYECKRRYTRDDMNNAQLIIMQKRRENNFNILKILMEENDN